MPIGALETLAHFSGHLRREPICQHAPREHTRYAVAEILIDRDRQAKLDQAAVPGRVPHVDPPGAASAPCLKIPKSEPSSAPRAR
jgi:hypothetical protein